MTDRKQPPQPSTSGPLEAVKKIVRIADEERFSDEFLGQVVRSYLPELERLLAPDAMFLEHSKMRRVPGSNAAANYGPADAQVPK